jgi:hypothetical protein
VPAQLAPRRRYSVSHFEVRFLALSVPSTSWIINSLSFEFEGQHRGSRDCIKPTARRCDVYLFASYIERSALSTSFAHMRPMECHIQDLDGPVEKLRIFAWVDWYRKLCDRLSFSRDDARSPEWADLLSRCTERWRRQQWSCRLFLMNCEAHG